MSITPLDFAKLRCEKLYNTDIQQYTDVIDKILIDNIDKVVIDIPLMLDDSKIAENILFFYKSLGWDVYIMDNQVYNFSDERTPKYSLRFYV